jgi:catechol 2,3-dioxygenase-like lactoylglutathione lyase family enzyme
MDAASSRLAAGTSGHHPDDHPDLAVRGSCTARAPARTPDGDVKMRAMRFRLELFVEDLDASVAFYERALGFRVARREPEYASVRRGDAELGLAPISRLPARGAGPGFSQERLARDRGAGVEIVLEVEDLAAAEDAVQRAGFALIEPPQERPWGLRDFRLADPDGYYVRVTTRAP